jgi:predicted transcriptional regulator
MEAGMPSTTALRTVMTTDVVTVTADITLAEAADVFADRGIGAAPVVDADGRVIGLLRDEDLLSSESRLHLPTTIAILGVNFTLPGEVARYDEELRKAIASSVGEVMETEFPHLAPDATLEDAATLMHEADVTHVVVIDDDGRAVGVVARGDLVRHLARST